MEMLDKSHLELHLNFIILAIGLILLFVIMPLEIVNATTSNVEEDNEAKNEQDVLKLNIKINLNTINNYDPNIQKIKLVSFVNGEVKEEYIDLLQEKSKAKNKILTLNWQFEKNNDISSIEATDQYFVCGYAVNDKMINQKDISLYDCDEGDIVSADLSTSRLFGSTLNKFVKSQFVKSQFEKNKGINGNTTNGNVDTLAKEVKINVKVPLADAIDDVGLISVIGMIKGEYKLEILDAKEALEKQKDNNDNILNVPFVFNRTTGVGTIQIGDMFFGCVAGENLLPQHTHCEKRMIKDFEKGNILYARKDNNFK
jgi:hypothetical protein